MVTNFTTALTTSVLDDCITLTAFSVYGAKLDKSAGAWQTLVEVWDFGFIFLTHLNPLLYN